jgi:hypothetical protein
MGKAHPPWTQRVSEREREREREKKKKKVKPVVQIDLGERFVEFDVEDVLVSIVHSSGIRVVSSISRQL